MYSAIKYFSVILQAKWYKEGADQQGLVLTLDDAKEVVYGEPYDLWKSKYQTPSVALVDKGKTETKSAESDTEPVIETRKNATIHHNC